MEVSEPVAKIPFAPRALVITEPRVIGIVLEEVARTPALMLYGLLLLIFDASPVYNLVSSDDNRLHSG
jgi:hypothetical protein